MTSAEQLLPRATSAPVAPLHSSVDDRIAQAGESRGASKGKRRKSIEKNSQKHEEHPVDRNITHGAFSISKAGYPAKFIWIPGKIKITPEVVDKIMHQWDKPYPSLMLRFKSGFAHPENLLTNDDVELHNERKGGNRSLKLLYKQLNDISGKKDITTTLNAILHRQLVSLVRQIVNVAALNDVWLVVHSRPTGIAVILEQVLGECDPMPVVLVVDAPRKPGYSDVGKNLKTFTKVSEKLAPRDEKKKPWTKNSISKTFGALLVDKGIDIAKYIERKQRRSKENKDDRQEPPPQVKPLLQLGRGNDNEANGTEASGRLCITDGTDATDVIDKYYTEGEVIDLGPWPLTTPVQAESCADDVPVYKGLQDDRFWKRENPTADAYILIENKKQELQEMYRDAIEQRLEETARLSSEITDKILDLRRPFDDPCDHVEKIVSEFWNDGTDKKPWPQSSAKDPDAWDVRFPQFMFRGGTHYLLFEDEATSRPATVLNNFGPKGSLFVGGGDATIEDIIESWREGDPTVLIDNTGRVTQAMAALHHDILEHFVKHEYNKENTPAPEEKWRGLARRSITQDQDILHDKLQDIPQLVWDFVRDFAGQKQESSGFVCKKTLKVEDIIETFHLYRHRHSILRLTCTCLDPLDMNLNERDITAQISQCFSSSRCVSTNLAGEQANHQAVATAWQLHSQLYETCAQNKKKSDRCGTALLALSLISLFVSLGLLLKETGDLETYFHRYDDVVVDVLKMLVIVLPALSGLINTVSSRMKYTTKWGLMKRASCIIEAEIFKFRTRVQDYAVVSAGASGSTEQQFSNRKSREQQVRQRFATKVLDTFHSHLAEIGEASLTQVREFDECSKLKSDIESYARAAQFVTICQFGADRKNLIRRTRPGALRDRIVENHSGTAIHARQIGKALEPEASDVHHPPKGANSLTWSLGWLVWSQTNPPKEKSRNIAFEFGFLNADSYFQARLLPALHTMTTDAYALQRLISVSEVLLGMCAALSTIAGALNQPMLVCSLVSIGVCLDSYVKQQGYNNRLITTNAGVRSLTKLNMGWTSQSPISQAKVSAITDMVEETENVRLSVINAWTGGIQAGQGSKKDRPQHGEDGDGGDDSGGATGVNRPKASPAAKKSFNAIPALQ